MTTEKLTDHEERFVKQFLIDRDPYAAALRTGVAKIAVKRTVLKWMNDPKIVQAIQQATDDSDLEDMISAQRVMAGFIEVAFDKTAPPAARNTALKELAAIKKMYGEGDKDVNRSGIVLLPAIASLADWDKAAQELQTKLKEEVRK